ncbi:uncharacterized protein K452DRAFT_317357 [Aplosporella prunicola CBS 121167]|uniref:Uncharacterized protein n=1 Tax=Aplosporella prunicola CBS 121167 TaxID=1176127 RepID=A0A6A6BGK8_9PEZI|nr:uncharacterized protein K452DRAFT_317357 [Aplosporella prunicola CBS 121167]KAF2143116.1 hypothetical protein K452DRAFT_317357 [Aplosporella prunicola CBS 121167]
MSSIASGNFPVYLGVWINWSKGPVFGSTLTLTRAKGDLLIAFIAFFVTFIGTRLWRILCLIFHTTGSKPSAQEGFYHQRQAILRNTANADSGLYRLIQILYAWRNTSKAVWPSLLPSTITAALVTAGFIVASGFSSQISSATGDEVLLTGSGCGIMENADNDLSSAASLWTPYESRQWTNAANYANECYEENSATGFVDCSTFISAKLPFSMQTNASCPFDEELCVTSYGNVLLDTGLLDSHDHFGINAPKSQRIKWRKTMHCAPLVTEGYKETSNSSMSLQSPKPVSKYYYGRRLDLDRNFTYRYGSNPQDHPYDFNMAPPSYTIAKAFVSPRNGSLSGWDSTLEPIPGLWRADGDLSVNFLSANGIINLYKIDDPWFKATTPGIHVNILGSHRNDNGSSLTTYVQDEAASPMACLERQQLCFTPPGQSTQICTDLGPTNDLVLGILAKLSRGSFQERVGWFYAVLTTPWNIIATMRSELQGSQLLARYHRALNGQGALPSNQWQLEMQYWFASILASVQQAFVRAATGSPSRDLDQYLHPPKSPEGREMCKNQKIRSKAYASFNMFGLIFVVTFGAVITLISYSIEPIMECLYRRSKHRDGYAYLEWVSNSTLQTQRMAHQSVGAGTWSKATDMVPLTEAGNKLATLDLQDPEQPVLRRSNGTFASALEMEEGSSICSEQSSTAAASEQQSVKSSVDAATQVAIEEVQPATKEEPQISEEVSPVAEEVPIRTHSPTVG